MILESFQKKIHVVVVVVVVNVVLLMLLVNLLSKFTLYSCIDLWSVVFIKNSVSLSLKLCDNKEIFIGGVEATLQLLIYSFMEMDLYSFLCCAIDKA